MRSRTVKRCRLAGLLLSGLAALALAHETLWVSTFDLGGDEEIAGIADRRVKPDRRTAGDTIVATPEFLLSVPVSGDYDIRLFDPCGNLCQDVFNGSLTSGAHRFSLRDQPAGLYLIRVTAPDRRVSSHRLVLLR
jgi:hypothetical protein